MDIIKREDKYANIFMDAYQNLSEKDQGAIFETRIKSDEKLVTPDYFAASLRLVRNIFDEDEDFALLVLRSMLPKEKLVSSELLTALEGELEAHKTK